MIAGLVFYFQDVLEAAEASGSHAGQFRDTGNQKVLWSNILLCQEILQSLTTLSHRHPLSSVWFYLHLPASARLPAVARTRRRKFWLKLEAEKSAWLEGIGSWFLMLPRLKKKRKEKKICKIRHADTLNLLIVQYCIRTLWQRCFMWTLTSGWLPPRYHQKFPVMVLKNMCFMAPFYLIEFCFNGFQVLRHPWIVDKAQLSDRALARQDADTVKVIITVIYHVRH